MHTRERVDCGHARTCACEWHAYGPVAHRRMQAAIDGMLARSLARSRGDRNSEARFDLMLTSNPAVSDLAS
jgi:hypothetical protein